MYQWHTASKFQRLRYFVIIDLHKQHAVHQLMLYLQSIHTSIISHYGRKSLGTTGSSSYINLFVYFNYVSYFAAVRNDTSCKCKVLHSMTINVLSLQIMYMTNLHVTEANIQTANFYKSQLLLPHFTFRARLQHLFPYDARILLPLFKIRDTPKLTGRED
jgi:hypothetical protein